MLKYEKNAECVYCIQMLVRRAAECQMTGDLTKKEAKDLIFCIVSLE